MLITFASMCRAKVAITTLTCADVCCFEDKQDIADMLHSKRFSQLDQQSIPVSCMQINPLVSVPGYDAARLVAI